MTGVDRVYTKNIPFSSNNPSSDQPIMEQNANSISDIISVDHSAFNTSDASGGYHSIIHQPVTLNSTTRSWNAVTRVFTPAVSNTSGLNQIIAANYTPDTSGGTADTQLFAMTGNGGVSQLTANSTSNATDGWCWVGGILIQWGRVTYGALTGGTVTFKDRVSGAIPFPNNLFTVATNETNNLGAITSPSAVYISTNALTFLKTQFNWSRSTVVSNVTGFQWIAIGN